jgi:hypothetical protein
MRIRSFTLTSIILVLMAVPLAKAGTPLICFPFQIGNAKSLPWIDDGGIGKPRSDYDIKRLVNDTVTLLGDETAVIVRMETIRRAVLYTAIDDRVGTQLLARMKARVSDESSRAHPLALFDYGYMIETMKQAATEKSRGIAAASGADGQAYVLQALKARGNDPEMEFALAKITMWPKQAQFEEHLRKAAAGADSDPLLAANLRSQFPTLNTILGGGSKSADGTPRRK